MMTEIGSVKGALRPYYMCIVYMFIFYFSVTS